MAGRGFDLDSDLPPGINVNIPAFMNGKDNLDIFDETETICIASVTIHVERAIARIKSFCILTTTFPISMASRGGVQQNRTAISEHKTTPASETTPTFETPF